MGGSTEQFQILVTCKCIIFFIQTNYKVRKLGSRAAGGTYRRGSVSRHTPTPKDDQAVQHEFPG